MKQIIRGKRYDTETAERVAEASANSSRREFNYWEENLYRKRTGEFFLYGVGGPASKYREHVGTAWSGGAKIIPLTIEEAKEWAEKQLDGDEYEEIFGPVEETDEKKVCTFSLPLDVIETIKRQAAADGVTLSEYIEKIVRARGR